MKGPTGKRELSLAFNILTSQKNPAFIYLVIYFAAAAVSFIIIITVIIVNACIIFR